MYKNSHVVLEPEGQNGAFSIESGTELDPIISIYLEPPTVEVMIFAQNITGFSAPIWYPKVVWLAHGLIVLIHTIFHMDRTLSLHFLFIHS